MNHHFNCIATGIGSLPIADADKAAALSLHYLPEAPFWPQLPQRDFREHMDAQYSETLPGIILDEVKKRVFFDTSRDLTPELERFFERYLEKDYGFFRMTDEYAPGFAAFIRAMKKGLPRGVRFVKGHITGPLTAGTSFKDETGRDIIHNDVLFDAVVKGLAMKAAWQIQELKQFNKPIIIFIDEPAMESLGSAFSAVSQEVVAEKLNEIIDTIHEAGRHRRHPLLRERGLAHDIQYQGGHRELRRLRIYGQGVALSRRYKEVLRPGRYARMGRCAHGSVHGKRDTGSAHCRTSQGHEQAGEGRRGSKNDPSAVPYYSFLRHGQLDAGQGRGDSEIAQGSLGLYAAITVAANCLE